VIAMSDPTHSSHSDSSREHENWFFSRTAIATVVALAVIGFLIYTGHSAHLLGFLPYLLILSCPLMHIFMHGGHHGHRHNSEHDRKSSDQSRLAMFKKMTKRLHFNH
jgi:hypothetical protein